MKTIPFFDYQGIYNRFEKEFQDIFHDVCSRGAFILQNDLIEFEDQLKEYLNINHVLGVADGTNAMLIGLIASGIKANDDILISSHTYVATANAVKLLGANPIPVDIGIDGMICIDSIKKNITNNTKAIMPTQLNGRCCNMDLIIDLCNKEGIQLFEDSAQGLGAKYKNKSAGTFGTFGTLSFYPAKLIGCFGDGGVVMTNDDDIAEKLFMLRDHGRDHNGVVKGWGTNSRLDNLQAAFLSLRLKHFHEDVDRRREIAAIYDEKLSINNNVKLPPAPSSSDHFDVYQNYEAEFNDRDKLKIFLEDRGVKTLVQWGGTPIHHFDDLGYGLSKYKDLKNTDSFFKKCLMLPMNMSVTNEEIKYICDSINEFYQS